MAIEIKKVHDLINDILEKEVGEYHSPEKIDRVVYAESLDLWQKYRKQLGTSEEVDAMLSPFVKPATLDKGQDGYFQLPDGCTHITIITNAAVDKNNPKLTKSYNIDLLTHNQWAERLNDPLVGPEDRYGIALRLENKLKVLPEEISRIDIVYLKAPVTPKYATKPVNNEQVFDLANSIDLEWDSVLFNDIVNRALGKLGLSQREGELVEYSEIKRQSESA